MKAKYFLPVAAVVLAACSDVTAPVNNLEVSAGKQTTPPPSGTVFYTQNFETGIASLGAWNVSTLATSPGSTKLASTSFLGRLLNDEVSLSIPAGKTSVTVSFDLYIIGTWDGAGYQGFGGDWWQIEVSKNGTRSNLFHTSFSNQSTKPQHFPKQVTDGTSPADKGAYAVNLLGYPKAAGKFDAGDAIYKLTYTISNPSGGPVVFYLHTTTPLQDLKLYR